MNLGVSRRQFSVPGRGFLWPQPAVACPLSSTHGLPECNGSPCRVHFSQPGGLCRVSAIHPDGQHTGSPSVQSSPGSSCGQREVQGTVSFQVSTVQVEPASDQGRGHLSRTLSSVETKPPGLNAVVSAQRSHCFTLKLQSPEFTPSVPSVMERHGFHLRFPTSPFWFSLEETQKLCHPKTLGLPVPSL